MFFSSAFLYAVHLSRNSHHRVGGSNITVSKSMQPLYFSLDDETKEKNCDIHMIRTSYRVPRIKESPLSSKIVPFPSFLPQATMLKLIRHFIDLLKLPKTFMLVGNGGRRTLNKGSIERDFCNHFLKWQIILKTENKHYSEGHFCFVLFSN